MAKVRIVVEIPPRKTRKIKKVNKQGMGTCATPVAHLRSTPVTYVMAYSES
jgi:hypothetical protein